MLARYLLDTNVCISFLNGTSDRLIAALRGHQPTEIRLSSIVRAELCFGARRSRRVAENLRAVQRFCQPFETLSFDDRCAEHYGAIRAELESSGWPIGPNDLLIAATARAHDLTLVTNNTREFARVTGLAVEDWL